MTSDDVLTTVVDRILGDYADRPFLTVDEWSELSRQGRTATYDAIRRGDGPPAVKWGRRVLIPVPALAAWLLNPSGHRPSNEDDPAVGSGEVVVALHGRADQGDAHG